jgi:hypothetical protein
MRMRCAVKLEWGWLRTRPPGFFCKDVILKGIERADA